MQTDLFTTVLDALGVQERPSTDTMILDIQDIGRLSFEVGTQEILLSLALPLPPADADLLPKALRLASYTHVLPFPLWVGAYAEHLVLITALEERIATKDVLLRATSFLLDIPPHLRSHSYGA